MTGTLRKGSYVQPLFADNEPSRVMIARPSEVILENGRRYHPTRLRLLSPQFNRLWSNIKRALKRGANAADNYMDHAPEDFMSYGLSEVEAHYLWKLIREVA